MLVGKRKQCWKRKIKAFGMSIAEKSKLAKERDLAKTTSKQEIDFKKEIKMVSFKREFKN